MILEEQVARVNTEREKLHSVPTRISSRQSEYDRHIRCKITFQSRGVPVASWDIP